MRLISSKSRNFNVLFGVKVCVKISPDLMMESSKVWKMRANLLPDVADLLPLLKIPTKYFGLI